MAGTDADPGRACSEPLPREAELARRERELADREQRLEARETALATLALELVAERERLRSARERLLERAFTAPAPAAEADEGDWWAKVLGRSPAG